jgi:predicted permease
MRRFVHGPSFFLATILTLSIGVTGVATMWTIYRHAVLMAVTVDAPTELVAVSVRSRTATPVPPTLSWPRFDHLQRATRSFSGVAAYSTESITVTDAGIPAEQLRALRVTAGFFRTLRLSPALGRTFSTADDLPNGPDVCVLSDAFARARFGDLDPVGRLLVLNGRPTEVIGVLPPRLSPPWADRQIFLPRVIDDSGFSRQAIANGASFLFVVGRLAPDVTVDDALTELQAVSAGYADEAAGRADALHDIAAQPLIDVVVDGRRAAVLALLAAVTIVMLVACINVAALVISRHVTRERELSVRAALGASRARLVGQLFRESLGPVVAAGLLGLAMTRVLLTTAVSSLAAELPAGIEPTIDWSTIGVTAGVLVCVLLIVGWLPALRATAPGPAVLAGFDRGHSTSASALRWRRLLVIGETALSVVLLVMSTLLLVSLAELRRTSPGFEPDGVAAALTNLPAARYPSAEHQGRFFAEVVERLAAMPEVESAAAVFGLPFHDENYAHPYAVAGRPIPSLAERSRAGLRIVTDDYFRVMRMRVTAGRPFTPDDRADGHRVCIVNASLARRLFGDQSPLGHTILRGREADQPFEIVGVVEDVKTNGLRNATPDEIFYVFRQAPRANVAVVARTAGDPAALVAAFNGAISQVDQNQAWARFAPMSERLSGTLALERSLAGVAATFAAVATLVAAIGLYAVLAHTVVVRRTELGVRLALGAHPGAVMRLVVGQSMRTVLIGIAAGLSAAWLGSVTLAGQLYGVSPRAVWVYGLVALVFAAVGLAAAIVPSLRASQVNPAQVLR